MKDLEFSSLMIPIDNKVKGLIRISVEQKIKMLELKVELHRLMFDLNDVKLVNTIMKGIIERCDQNPLNNDSIFSTINSKILKSFRYNYYQLEDLSNKFKFINEYDDLNEEVEFPGDIFGIKMKLFVRDVRRIQRFINSFLFNYPIILDTLRFIENKAESLKPAAENGSYFEEPIKTAAGENELVELDERTLIDQILEFLIISPQLLSYLIHLILNYYRFFKISECNLSEKKLTVKLNSIVPCELAVNKSYLYGLMKSLENVSLDTVNLHTKNLTKFMYNYADKLGNIELCCCSFILFFFSLRHLIETHKTWLETNIDDVFLNVDGQIRMLNKYIPKISGIPVEYVKCEKEEEDSPAAEIKRISEKYAYMKSMDQEKFAEFVFNETGQPKTAAGINIGIKNILDLDKLASNKESVSEFIERNEKQNLNSILSYQKTEDNKITTNSFSLFLKYIENPVVLVTDKEKTSSIPNNVLNCFEKLKSLLNDSNFRKEDINTQHYYEKLMNVLPEDFQFPNAMYIIYQIIVPYMNYFHGVKLFEDVFLTTYKIE